MFRGGSWVCSRIPGLRASRVVASDAPTTNAQDATRRDEGSSSTTVDVLHAGLHKVEELVLKYGRIHTNFNDGPHDMADV